MFVVNKAYFAENHTVSKLRSDGVAQSCVITNRQKLYAYSGDKEIGVLELDRLDRAMDDTSNHFLKLANLLLKPDKAYFEPSFYLNFIILSNQN